ncbi:hypothetical protein BC834DRAFT_863201 [Gloeopeniophorella convolvens]|nr:hypothetical protein BC834DRAFT_863201 [Gloeopeniophorella convolvens]
MASKSYEFVFWPAGDGYRNDQSVSNPAFQFLKDHKAEAIFHGLQVEEPAFGLIVVWDKIQVHKDLMADAVEYPKLLNLLKPTMGGGDIDMSHVDFLIDPTPAFKAPITEIAFTSPKTPEDKEAVQARLEQIVSLANGPTKTAFGAAYGPVVEKPDTFVLVVGWDSVEAHLAAREANKELTGAAGKIANVKVRHVALSPYTA